MSITEKSVGESDHVYIRGDIDQRSPCPFLNSLANHNYLPRHGEGITRNQLKSALRASADCTPLIAHILSSIVRPLLNKDGTFDLVDLRMHNVIEHDASFTRLDDRQGDNYTFQPAMFDAMLKDAEGGPITRDSLAMTRARRDKECAQAFGYKPLKSLGVKLYFTTWSQTCILLQTFGESISQDDISVFYREERLPEAWPRKRGRKMSFAGLVGDIASVWWKHWFVKVSDTTLKDAESRPW